MLEKHLFEQYVANLNNAWGQSKRSGKMCWDHQQNVFASTAFAEVQISSHTSVSQDTNTSVAEGLCSTADRASMCSTPNSTSSLPEQMLRCTSPTLRKTSASSNSTRSSRSCCTARPRRANLSASSNPRTSPSYSGWSLDRLFSVLFFVYFQANVVHSM